jgi:mono/diheme cytochrome c family protein
MLYLNPMLHQTSDSIVPRGAQRAALRATRRNTLLAAAAFAVLATPRPLGGHEVPERVAISAFVHPDGARGVLRVVARVPLEAMRDVDFPVQADSSLHVAGATALLPEAARLWVANYLAFYEDGRDLLPARITATRLSLPSDRAFESYATAVAHVADAPLGEDTGLRWQQAMLDLVIEYPIESAASRFAVEPRLAHLGVRTTTVLRLVLPDAPAAAANNAAPGSRTRAFTYVGDPGRIELDPSFLQAAARFVVEGFRHILGGLDHLLFILCLVLPVRRWRPLVAIVTAFTVAHSLTLGAASLGLVPGALWFPPLVEALIALSIAWLAIENVLLPAERLEDRWRMAFGFGLIHGFGFSFALGEQLQFAGAHLLTSLAAFNAGVELGQLLVLVLAVPALALLRRYAGADRGRLVTIVGSVLVAHVAWHWMTARFSTLAEYRASLAWPAVDGMFALGALRVALLAAVALAVALAFRQVLRAIATRGARAAVLPLVVALAGAGAFRAGTASAAPAGHDGPGARRAIRAVPITTRDTVSTADGVYTTVQATKGKDVFASACQSCHTPTVHAGPPFRNKWFGRTLGDLFTYLRENMPQADPGSMSDEEYVLVTAYLLRINGMPAGEQPLAANVDSLHRIRLDSLPSRK